MNACCMTTNPEAPAAQTMELQTDTKHSTGSAHHPLDKDTADPTLEVPTDSKHASNDSSPKESDFTTAASGSSLPEFEVRIDSKGSAPQVPPGIALTPQAEIIVRMPSGACTNLRTMLAAALTSQAGATGADRTPQLDQVFLETGVQWHLLAELFGPATPQRAFALAMATLASPDALNATTVHDSKQQDLLTTRRVVADSNAKAPQDEQEIPMAAFEVPEFNSALAIGTTYPSPAGGLIRCQDGIYLGKYASVVTDGHGGNRQNAAEYANVRIAQTAAGSYVAALIETIGNTQTRPCTFLEQHYATLVQLASSAVRDLGIEGAAASCTATATYPDGKATFGVGNGVEKALLSDWKGSTIVESFCPPHDEYNVWGLGNILNDGHIGLKRYKNLAVKMFVLATDGLFKDAIRFVDITSKGKSAGESKQSGDSKGAGSGNFAAATLVALPLSQVRDMLVGALGERTRDTRVLTSDRRFAWFRAQDADHEAAADYLGEVGRQLPRRTLSAPQTALLREGAIPLITEYLKRADAKLQDRVFANVSKEDMLTLANLTREDQVQINTLAESLAIKHTRDVRDFKYQIEGYLDQRKSAVVVMATLKPILEAGNQAPLPDLASLVEAGRREGPYRNLVYLDDFAVLVRKLG